MKIVLVGVANHAHPDGGQAYPAKSTLAEYACCDEKTVQRALRKLENGGWLIRDGVGPRGQNKYLLPLWIDPTAGTQMSTPPWTPLSEGNLPPLDTAVPKGGALVSPEPKEPFDRAASQAGALARAHEGRSPAAFRAAAIAERREREAQLRSTTIAVDLGHRDSLSTGVGVAQGAASSTPLTEGGGLVASAASLQRPDEVRPQGNVEQIGAA